MFKQLKNYCSKDICPMHMPGHKRNTALLGNALPYAFDITEIEGFDYLHDPTGLIKDIHCRAQKLYGCDHSFMLVNGSTGGILAAVCAVTNYGDKVLVARNCHKSVYNAIELNGLDAVYLLPEYDDNFNIFTVINPSAVEEALNKNPDIKAVILTSPTYEGFVSDIKEIAEITHQHNIPLFVDEAHGAHFGLSAYFPDDAVSCGADIAVMGLHKTLPALTQCALLNVKSKLVNIDILKEKLSVFQTSSPSYILMSSIDRYLSLMEENRGELFEKYNERIDNFYNSVKNLNKLKVHSSSLNFDKGKILISTASCNMNGMKLAEILRSKYNIELEMAYDCYAAAMTSICDTDENFKRLSDALLDIDPKIKPSKIACKNQTALNIPKKELCISETKKIRGEVVLLSEAAGRISLEYIYAYPPGIPIIVPGEIIDGVLISQIINLQKENINLKSGSVPIEKGIFAAK